MADAVPPRLRATNLLALLCLPALAPAVAPWLAPWHWLADLLACFAAQALACLLPAALLLAAARRIRLAALMAAGALSAGAAILVAFVAAAGEPTVAGPSRLRVFAANLLFGNEGNAPAFLAAVRARDPDVLFLCEVTPAWLAALDAPLSDYPFRCQRAAEGSFGVALLSRLPLRDAAVAEMAYDWAPAIAATVQTSTGPLGVLGIHPPRPGGARHNAERDRALAALPDLLARLPVPRVVLGDCNATPFNPSFRAMLTTTQLRRAGGARWLPTWPQQLPWPLRVPIDHVLLGAGVQARTFDTGPAFGSDHAPIFAELTW